MLNRYNLTNLLSYFHMDVLIRDVFHTLICLTGVNQTVTAPVITEKSLSVITINVSVSMTTEIQ